MKARNRLNKVISKSRYRLHKLPLGANLFESDILQLEFEYVLAHRLMRADDFFFVQVGANDGVTNDPIYNLVTNHALSGIVIEPLPDLFAKLRSNYRNYPQVTAVQKALHRTASQVTIYRVDPDSPQAPASAQGKASLSREHLLKWKHRIANLDELIVEQSVPSQTLMELLGEHQVSRVDLLQIDVEGYDFEVIKMIDFATLKPAIIRYECQHLSKSDIESCLELLTSHGYKFLFEKRDTTAYLADSAP